MKTNTRIKTYLLAFISVMQIWMISCTSQYAKTIDLAESLIKTSPYTADSILDSINESTKLNKQLLAKWCLLKCIISDSIQTPMPNIQLIEESFNYYKNNNDWPRSVKTGFYLGSSYKEAEDYEKAIEVYLYTLTKSKETKDYTFSGYIYSCVANIYEHNRDVINAEKNYELAKDYFLQAQNTKSYILALKNIARQKAYQDSYEEALNILQTGDSIAQILNDNSVFMSLYNTIGNVYELMGNQKEAEKYLLKSISIDSTMDINSSYLALTQMYLDTKDLEKANFYLSKVDSEDIKYTDIIAYYKYLYEKEKENYKLALEYFEIWDEISTDKTTKIEEENILELEKKYDQAINESKLQELKISRLIFIVIFCLLLIGFILLHYIYQKYKINTRNKISKLEERINSINNDLEIKKREIESGKKDLEKLELQEHKLDALYSELKSVKATLLKNTNSGKKINDLTQKYIPNNQEALIDEKFYKLMEKDIRNIYPKYKALILDLYPEISVSEWQYCCLLIFGLDNKSESRLLCISPQSVRTRRLRLRKKLGIELEDMSIYQYLIDRII